MGSCCYGLSIVHTILHLSEKLFVFVGTCSSPDYSREPTLVFFATDFFAWMMLIAVHFLPKSSLFHCQNYCSLPSFHSFYMPMNINGCVPLLINTLDIIVRKGILLTVHRNLWNLRRTVNAPWQTWGRKVSSLVGTFGWASCKFDNFVPLV